MWSRKGATLSDKSARQEFGLTQDEIIAAIRAGKLQFRESNPTTPNSKLVLATDDHVPELQVTPDASQGVEEVHIYYSVDSDSRSRFWRSAEAKKENGAGEWIHDSALRRNETWTTAI